MASRAARLERAATSPLAALRRAATAWLWAWRMFWYSCERASSSCSSALICDALARRTLLRVPNASKMGTFSVKPMLLLKLSRIWLLKLEPGMPDTL